MKFKTVLQGAPSLLNLSIDHILDNISEDGLRILHGLKDSLFSVSILGFTDDTVLVVKEENCAIELYKKVRNMLSEIGLSLNTNNNNNIYIRK